MGPKNGGSLEKWGSKPYILVSLPPKGTFLRGTTSFDEFCVKINARVSAEAFLKYQKSSRVTLCRTETPKPIWIKFGAVVDIPDTVTHTNFGDHRSRGFWMAGVKFLPFPLTFVVALTTLSYYRASV